MMKKREFGKVYEIKTKTIRVRNEIDDTISNLDTSKSFNQNLDDFIVDAVNATAPIEVKELTVVEKKKPKARTVKEKNNARQVKEAYIESYKKRYGIRPSFSVTENSLMYVLLTAVGYEESLELARVYPFYNDQFHVNQKHPFKLLVNQIDKVRVETKDPRRMFDGLRVKSQLKEFEKEFDKETKEQKRAKDNEKLLELLKSTNKEA